MTKMLTTQNAQITTAAVEVKTLTISGKQVTLAVFRQLREEPLISEDGTLNGVPWGTVNYHPDKCGDDSDHVHVVWQKGTDLFRRRVNAPGGFADVRCSGAGHVIEAFLAEVPTDLNLAKDAATCGLAQAFVSDKGDVAGHYARFTYDGIRFIGYVRAEFYESRSTRSPLSKELRRSALADELGPYESVAALAARLLPVAEYRARWQEIEALPQLFIAV